MGVGEEVSSEVACREAEVGGRGAVSAGAGAGRGPYQLCFLCRVSWREAGGRLKRRRVLIRLVGLRGGWLLLGVRGRAALDAVSEEDDEEAGDEEVWPLL